MRTIAGRALLMLMCTLCYRSVVAEECASKVQGFVNATGYTITVAKPCEVWVAQNALTIPRGAGVTGLLLIAQSGETVIVGGVVQSKDKLTLSADLLMKLMQTNNELEFAKIGIDNDGDLFVRAELHASSVTADDFSSAVKNVVEGSRRVYDLLGK
jgi:hypothetical protein